MLALFAAACGGERSFEPEEFVDQANAEGASLVLGEQLTTIEEGVDVFAISFAEEKGHEREQEPDGQSHSGGSMIVTSDSEAATEEFQRCETAVTLTCYRAANVVLYFDVEPSDEQVAKVDAAIRALASE
jgi:hypothetical protein